MFLEKNDKFVPRSVFIDLEPLILWELYDQEFIISGKEDTSRIFSTGYNNKIKNECMEKIRKLTEQCESL